MAQANARAKAPIQNKLSVATVYGKVNVRQVPETGELWLMTAVGRAIGIKTGSSDYGDWVALTGTFECANVQTGEAFRGTKLFLPEMLTAPIAAAIANGGVADFAFKVGVKASERSPVGYEYVAESFLDPSGDGDPIEAVKQKAGLLALPAPGDTAKQQKGRNRRERAAAAAS